MTKKIVIFGLDGASWNNLDFLIKRGLMPQLGKLVKKHGQKNLTSSYPPNTLPAWMDFATGCNSGKHGIYDLLQFNQTNFDLEPLSYAQRPVATFYETLD